MGYIVECQETMGNQVYWITNSDTLALDKLSSKYLKHKTNLHRSPNSVRSIAYALSYYLTFLEKNNMSIVDVFKLQYADQYAHFSDFLSWLKRGEHCATKKIPKNNTCNAYLAAVLGFLMFAVYEDVVDEGLKVYRGRDMTYYNSAGVRSRQYVYRFDGYLPKNEHRSRTMAGNNLIKLINACTCIRNKLMLMLLAETGLRIGELLGVDYTKDIDFENRCIWVKFREDNENDARAKNGEYRAVYFSGETLDLLNTYIADNAEYLSGTKYLFINLHGKTAGKPMTVNGVYSFLAILEKTTGIESTPHMLRHYFARERLKAGWELIEISTALGHKHIHTTEVYLGIADEDIENVSDHYYEQHQALYDIRKLI